MTNINKRNVRRHNRIPPTTDDTIITVSSVSGNDVNEFPPLTLSFLFMSVVGKYGVVTSGNLEFGDPVVVGNDVEDFPSVALLASEGT